jgi:hypothetical protein
MATMISASGRKHNGVQLGTDSTSNPIHAPDSRHAGTKLGRRVINNRANLGMEVMHERNAHTSSRLGSS